MLHITSSARVVERSARYCHPIIIDVDRLPNLRELKIEATTTITGSRPLRLAAFSDMGHRDWSQIVAVDALYIQSSCTSSAVSAFVGRLAPTLLSLSLDVRQHDLLQQHPFPRLRELEVFAIGSDFHDLALTRFPAL